MDGIDLREKFATFAEHWSPRIVAELNGQHVKLVKFRGQPVADDEVEVVLLEPAGTLNTGNLLNERTVREPARL